MSTPLPGNTSQTARLMVAPPGFAVGWQEPLYLPDPVAGAEWSHVVDGRYFERLLAAQYMFTADAAVATRYAVLGLYDVAGRQVLTVPAAGGVVAATAVTANLMTGIGVLSSGTIGNTWGVLPDLLVPPGWSWRSATSGIDAGDQYSGITLVVQRFPNDATSIVAGQ